MINSVGEEKLYVDYTVNYNFFTIALIQKLLSACGKNVYADRPTKTAAEMETMNVFAAGQRTRFT